MLSSSFAIMNIEDGTHDMSKNTLTSQPSLIPEDSLTLQLYPVLSHLYVLRSMTH